MSDDLVKHGYADGSYTCICRNCGGHFIGGKRALTCKGCATYAEALQAERCVEVKPLEWLGGGGLVSCGGQS